MNRLKIYSDKECTKEVTLKDDEYILQQHTNTIDRDVKFHLYIKNISDDAINTLKVVNRTNNGIILNDISNVINAGEVIEVIMTIRISKLVDKTYLEVIGIEFKPVGDSSYDGLSKTKLTYLIGKTYQYIINNYEHEDIKINVNIITPIKIYNVDVIIFTSYKNDATVASSYVNDINI